MSGQVFISYRRDDASYPAGRLYDRLLARLPNNHIFIDVDLDPGIDFFEAIEASVGSCDVLIAVIGNEWLLSSDEGGKRRLDNPDDFVRLEIATALKRNIRVIPVLVDTASMPRSNDLPEDLKLLARRNAIEVSHNRFNADFGRLVTAVETVLKKADDERKQREEQDRVEAERLKREQKEQVETDERQRREEQERQEGKRQARYPRTCFFCYASLDRAEMLKRAQGFRAAGLETFIDVMTLRPDDTWNAEIFRAIDKSDLFVLIWSNNARESEWVEREWRYALTRNHQYGSPEILPIVVEGPPIALVPEEMRAYHFDDHLIRDGKLETRVGRKKRPKRNNPEV